jgi:two-component system sensor kinase FixL
MPLQKLIARPVTVVQRNADQLVSMIAHELAQPLAVITLLADSLCDNADNAVVKSALQIMNQVGRVSVIIRRVRDGKIEPHRTLTQINPLITQAVETVVLALKPTNVEISLNLDDDVTMMSIDAGQMEQVLANLVRNALEAMQDGGRLNIDSRLTETELEIVIADEGSGINPDIADRLFQSYVTTKPNGFGIGLLISRDIVRAHGGDLAVQENRNIGACFIVKLPLVLTGA